jgi:hypothetical protein
MIINGTLQTIFYKYADVKYLPPGLSENLNNQAGIHKKNKASKLIPHKLVSKLRCLIFSFEALLS